MIVGLRQDRFGVFTFCRSPGALSTDLLVSGALAQAHAAGFSPPGNPLADLASSAAASAPQPYAWRPRNQTAALQRAPQATPGIVTSFIRSGAPAGGRSPGPGTTPARATSSYLLWGGVGLAAILGFVVLRR